MTGKWELSAQDAAAKAAAAPMRKIQENQRKIMQKINSYAEKGKHEMTIYMDCYETSCLEDWSYLYNWLLNLGYIIEDNSGQKIDPYFIIRW